jgi:hypothetical protein
MIVVVVRVKITAPVTTVPRAVIVCYHATTATVNVIGIIYIDVVIVACIWINTVSVISITAVWRSAKSRTVSNRATPPAAIPVVPGTAAKAHVQPAVAIIKSNTPSVPGRITYAKAPCVRTRVIIPAVPWTIIITGTIYNGRTINKCV